MKSKDVKRHINTAISNSVPDALDEIVTKCEKKKGFKKNMTKDKIIVEEKKNNIFKSPKFVGIVCTAAVLLMVLGVVGINRFNTQLNAVSVIELDVNPSIELKVNKDKEVIGAEALNEDAKKVLKDMDLEDVDLNVAVNAIIGSMMKNGYLNVNQNSILVSVKNNNEEERVKLQKEISKEIDSLLTASKIGGSVLTQSFDDEDDKLEKLADEYGISEGKAKLINNILEAKVVNSKGEAYTFQTLAGLSITELNLLLSGKNTTIKNVETTGKASESGYIGKEKAFQIALKDAGIKNVKFDERMVEFDADDGLLIYEVEFKSGKMEYEYDIDAKTGKILHKEIDLDDDKDDNDDKDDDKYDDDDKDDDKDDDDKDDDDDRYDDDRDDNDDDKKVNNNTTKYIGNNKAKEIALKNAGVSENKVKELEVELDKDDNKYEVEFKYNETEYSYEINASTGKIIHKEVDND